MNNKKPSYVYDMEVLDNHNFVVEWLGTGQGVVVSNCHHTSARVFSKALFKLSGIEKQIGLSATPKRTDKLEKVFFWHIGDVIHEMKTKSVNVMVKIVHVDSNLRSLYRKNYKTNERSLDYVKMITSAVENEFRNEAIASETRLLIDQGRTILVVSERKKHLERIDKLLDKDTKKGFYVGGKKQKELDEVTDNCQVILATLQMVEEGFDWKPWNTIVLSSPVTTKNEGRIQQIIGRMLRSETEHVPKLVDIVDKNAYFSRMGKSRQKYYVKNGYDIEDNWEYSE